MDLLQSLSSVKSNKLEKIIWSAKLVLLTMGTLSTLVLFKVVIVPYTYSFIFSTFPPLLVFSRSLLSPPFLYIIVNFIIITIAVSSNFHSKQQPTYFKPADSITTIITENYVLDDIHSSDEPTVVEQQEVAPVHDSAKLDTDPPPENDSGYGLSSEEKCDDMEATWNAIMERQGKQVAGNLKKSETWAERTKAEPVDEREPDDSDHVAWERRELKKSDTFNDTASLKREKSMSQEELYCKAEAFIQKINNQIRLQRLESHQRFMEIVNGGA